MKTSSIFLLPAICILDIATIYAQDNIGFGTETPNASAIVDIEATDKGFLMPRYATNAGTKGHSVPAVEGMLFYDATQNNVMLHNGSGWATQGFMPVGAITMWQGTTPPGGWALCDGTNGTPNLQGKFIVGYDPADTDYNSIGKGGGENFVTLQLNHLPSHTHGINDPAHTHAASLDHRHTYTIEEYTSRLSTKAMVNNGGSPSFQQSVTTSTSSFSASVGISPSTIGTTTVGYTGGGQPIDNRPPYYVLAFIMKIN